MRTIKRHIKTTLLSTLLTSSVLFAVTPTPTPTPVPFIPTPVSYEPICGTDPLVDCADTSNGCGTRTYYNQEEFEQNGGVFLHDGICPTPTPQPSIEVICDKPDITTTSYNRTITEKQRKPIFFNILSTTHTNNIIVGINSSSIKFFKDTIGNQASSLYIEDEGRWDATENGATFWPNEDFNGTSTVHYTIENNCGTPSNVSTLSVTIDSNETTTPIPVFDPICFFLTLPSLLVLDDIRILEPFTDIAVIDVLNNDNAYVVPPTLRIIDNNKLVTKLTVKNKGKWLVDTNAGDILFIPNKNFSGEAKIKYVISNICHNNESTENMYYETDTATVTVIAPTPTPTPCPKAQDPVCGVENICTTEDDTIICEDRIPKQMTYDSLCELEGDNAIFIYTGACKKPTPIPTPTPTVTPKPTPTITPKPKPAVVTVEPIITNTQTTEDNTTQTVKSDNGNTLSWIGMLLWSIFAGLISIKYMKTEEV